MVQPSNLQVRGNISEWSEVHFTMIERRIDLVRRYKKHVDQSANVSQEQLDFVNGFMHPVRLKALALHYDSAVRTALEIADAEAKRIREEALAAKKCSRPDRYIDRTNPAGCGFDKKANYIQGDTMDSIEAMIRRAKRDVALIAVLQEIRSTLQILQTSGVGIDLRHDIEKLSGALILLGSPS